MARKPKPPKLKIIAGNPGKRELPEHEPTPKPYNLDRPPTWLKGRGARRNWRKMAPELKDCGILTELDVPAFALLCQALETYEEAHEHVVREGSIIKGSGGGLVKSPWVRIMDDAVRASVALLKDFGMTPGSRSGVTAVPVNQGSDDWDDFD